MAQTSTTISGQRDYKAEITVTEGCNFTHNGGVNTISSTDTSLANLAPQDVITISQSLNNDGSYTVKSVASDGLSITVQETVTTETRDGSTSTILTWNGFVTDKHKGDGYYSQTDGFHTIAFHVGNTLEGQLLKIRAQGSLATNPTEDDWFDIASTQIVDNDLDGSTSVFASNFSGNFVWIRAKATGITTGSVAKILFNH